MRKDVYSCKCCKFLTSRRPSEAQLPHFTTLRVLSFLYQTLSKSGQGRISGPKQHVAVQRSEESLQKGKVCSTFLLHGSQGP